MKTTFRKGAYSEMKKSLKGLLEKRNHLASEGKKLLENAKAEKRGLTDQELETAKEYRSHIEVLNDEIKSIEEIRSDRSNLENEVGVEKKDKKKEDVELEKETRSLEDLYLRNSPEFRDALSASDMTAGNAAPSTDGNGGITISETVYSKVIAKLEQISPVFAMAKHYESVNGRLSITREDKASADTGFIGEGENAPQITNSLTPIVLDQHRVAAYFKLTQSLVNDSAIDVVGYAVEQVSRSIARAISRGILVGAKDGEKESNSFRSVTKDKDVKQIKFAGEVPTVDELIQFYSQLHQGYQNGAAWVVSNAVFQAMAKLKDGDGRYLIFSNIVDGKPEYKMFGAPVYIDDALDGSATPLVYGNFGEGYAVMIKKGINLMHVTQDTQQVLAGTHLVVMDAYMDGAVVNPDAFLLGATTAPASK